MPKYILNINREMKDYFSERTGIYIHIHAHKIGTLRIYIYIYTMYLYTEHL